MSVERATIEKNKDGRPETHYIRIYRAFRRYEAHGCFDAIFESVSQLHQKEYLDISVIHGDGTTTARRKAATTSDSVGTSTSKGIKLLPSAIATAMSSPLL